MYRGKKPPPTKASAGTAMRTGLTKKTAGAYMMKRYPHPAPPHDRIPLPKAYAAPRRTRTTSDNQAARTENVVASPRLFIVNAPLATMMTIVVTTASAGTSYATNPARDIAANGRYGGGTASHSENA